MDEHVKLYSYVGPKHLARHIGQVPTGFPVQSSEDISNWIQATGQETNSGVVIATYVIDESGTLLLADRRSEHVACAGGRPVRSAGEITFTSRAPIEVIGISNQSTGYCPEPESWPSVAAALARATLATLDGFTLSCIFRKCLKCDSVTLVKDNLFDCGMCGAELPAAYNVQPIAS